MQTGQQMESVSFEGGNRTESKQKTSVAMIPGEYEGFNVCHHI